MVDRKSQTIVYHKQKLTIANVMSNRAGEGISYCNLGNAYHSLGNFKQAIEYHNQDLTIAKELGDQSWRGLDLWISGQCLLQSG